MLFYHFIIQRSTCLMKKVTRERICLIPLAVWFVIIPLIVKVKFYANPLADYSWYSSDATLADFFLYYKSVVVTITGVLMLAFLVWQIAKVKRKDTLFHADTRIFLPIGIYLLFAIASSLFSDYGYFCIHGMPEQFETIWNLIAYVIALVYCYYVIVYHDSDKPILGIIIIGVACVTAICVLQYLKLDIYRMIYSGEGYTFTFELGQVYGPFYNTNYVGYYTLLFVPLFVMFFIVCKNWIMRIISAILTIGLVIAMVGARSLTAEIVLPAVVLFAIFFVLLKNVKAHKIIWLPLAGMLVCGIVGCVLLMPRVDAYIQASDTGKTDLENIFTNDTSVEFDYKGNKLFIQMYEGDGVLAFNLYDQDQNIVPCEYTDSADGSYYYYTVTDERFSGFILTPAIITEDPLAYGFMVQIDDKTWSFTNQCSDDGTYYYYTDLGKVTKLTEDTVSDSFAPLADKSSLASGRGYIWNKTIALLKNYIFLGSGADTYAVVYPNDDVVSKYNNGYDNLILTKPHNLYLQIAVQTGVLSLICFLVFYLWYFISSLRLYFKQRLTTPLAAVGFAILLGTMGYMISGLANDSTITIAPLYWGLMGIGIGINHRIRVATKLTKE